MDMDLINQNLTTAELGKSKQNATDIQKGAQEEKLKEACAGFEAILLHTLIKSMRKSLPGDAFLEQSHSVDMYQSMQDQYLSQELSKSTFSSGIKEFLYQQLKHDL